MVIERAHRHGHRPCRGCKVVLAALLLVVVTLLSTQAHAIREEQVFEVSVTIPTADFYVLPINPVFLEREQEMAWNLVTRTLKPLREHFDVKNSTGRSPRRATSECCWTLLPSSRRTATCRAIILAALT